MEEYTIEQLKQELWKREAESEKLIYLEGYDGSALIALEGNVLRVDRWTIHANTEEAFKLRILLSMLGESNAT